MIYCGNVVGIGLLTVCQCYYTYKVEPFMSIGQGCKEVMGEFLDEV